MRATVIAMVGAMFWPASAMADLRIAPYKDELFGYRNILGTLHGGDFVVVEFDQERDVDGRDEVPLRKVRDAFVDLGVNDHKRDVLIRRDGEVVQYLAVGAAESDARLSIIYLHGLHGDRTLAMEDLRFGGNFNRVKNLMARNGGIFVSPDFSSFGAKGAREVLAVMNHLSENARNAPIFLACASTGCKLVYRLLADPAAVGMLGGVIMHGALPAGAAEGMLFDLGIFRTPEAAVPIYIGHGSSDETVPWVAKELLFKRIKALNPDYPIRFELFKGPDAVHGTPIRMMDWRAVLNWMLASGPAQRSVQ